MPFVGPEVAVRQKSDEDWELLEDLVYEGNRDTFMVGAGFRTDLASVPQAFTWLVPRYGRYTKAAVLHDHLCRLAHDGRFSRYDADGIFRRTMRELGVGFLRRWLMWVAVRFGGGWRGLWERGFLRGAAVACLGVAAMLFLLVPTLVVGAWMLFFYVLEWISLPALAIVSRRKVVNPPRGLKGT